MEQIQDISLSARAAEVLRKNIIEGKYVQGQKLTEEDCAQSLGLSRICVREAFAQLVREGLLVKQVNRCTTVATFTKDDVTDIYYLRLSLEKMCIQLCFERNLLPREELLHSISRMRALVEKGEENTMFYLQEDLQFHAKLVDASASNRAAVVWHSIEGQMLTLLFPVISEYMQRFDSDSAVREHELLTDALITGQRERVDELIEYHILNSMEILSEIIEKQNS